MRRIKLYLIILLFFILLVSCSKSGIKLYKDGKYEDAINVANTNLNGKLKEKSLYVKAASLYNLHKYEEAREAASIYYYLFDNNKLRRESILRIILFTDNGALALKAGEELQQMKELTKEGAIQYFKLLNENNRYNEANSFLDAVRNSYTTSEIEVMTIRGKAITSKLVNVLEDVYDREGVTPYFINLMSEALPVIAERRDETMIIPLIDKSFDNDKLYSMILKNFFTRIGDKERAISYIF